LTCTEEIFYWKGQKIEKFGIFGEHPEVADPTHTKQQKSDLTSVKKISVHTVDPKIRLLSWSVRKISSNYLHSTLLHQ